jgi:two-component system chemotaxis response regulator CheY
VVDDEEDVRTYLLTVFADAGARICEAEDGAEAIAVAKKLKPDLITLDLSMPGVDGVDAFCEIRQTPEIGETPICIITGHPEFRKVIYDRPETPPEGYLNKPVDEDTLVSTVRRILALRQRKAMRKREG